MALAAEVEPDLVLMDIRMPGGSGLTATARIKAARPATAIVMLTVSEDEDDLFEAIKSGAQGYLLKNLEAAQLRSMLDAVGSRARRRSPRRRPPGSSMSSSAASARGRARSSTPSRPTPTA